jgi:acetyltransferase-like isoleucine patch superfamily enzyme
MIKKIIQRLFNLRTDVGLNYYIIGVFYKYIFRQNRDVPWIVHHTATVKCPKNIIRGLDVYPGDSPNNFIEALNGIEIDDFTNIGPNVSIISCNYELENNKKMDKHNIPIKIGKFCWLGTNAVILPKVEIGDFTIVAAGAIVTKSFTEGYAILAGNPATVIKKLDRAQCEITKQERYNSFHKK